MHVPCRVVKLHVTMVELTPLIDAQDRGEDIFLVEPQQVCFGHRPVEQKEAGNARSQR